MGWLKHKMDAGDDPFIVDLMNEFGPRGYWVYFRTLELMRQNFNTRCPGKLDESWVYFRQKFRLNSGSIRKVLTYIHSKRKFEVEFGDTTIFIYCPNFQRYMDKYTRRLLLEEVGTKVGTKGVQEYRLNRREEIYKDVNSTDMETTKEKPMSNLVYRIYKNLIRRGEG